MSCNVTFETKAGPFEARFTNATHCHCEKVEETVKINNVEYTSASIHLHLRSDGKWVAKEALRGQDELNSWQLRSDTYLSRGHVNRKYLGDDATTAAARMKFYEIVTAGLDRFAAENPEQIIRLRRDAELESLQRECDNLNTELAEINKNRDDVTANLDKTKRTITEVERGEYLPDCYKDA